MSYIKNSYLKPQPRNPDSETVLMHWHLLFVRTCISKQELSSLSFLPSFTRNPWPLIKSSSELLSLSFTPQHCLTEFGWWRKCVSYAYLVWPTLSKLQNTMNYPLDLHGKRFPSQYADLVYRTDTKKIFHIFVFWVKG